MLHVTRAVQLVCHCIRRGKRADSDEVFLSRLTVIGFILNRLSFHFIWFLIRMEALILWFFIRISGLPA